jgi:dTDP-4-amino-4,6-dideoxygalactose transaminase
MQLLLGGVSPHPVLSWLQNARIYYVHRARTAIRHLPELLRIAPGDEILMPAYNCGTEVDPFLHAGISIELYRVDKSSRIDIPDIRRRVTGQTKGVYVTHYFGFPQPLAELKEFCRERGLYLIEDCALSLFSSDDTTKLGTVGDVAVFSFPKSLPVPDGGALVVNNPDLDVGQWPMRAPNTITVLKGSLSLFKSGALRSLSRGTLSCPVCRALIGLRGILHSAERANALKEWSRMPQNYYYSEEMTDRGMSRMTQRALARFDFTAIIEKRRANYQKLFEAFSEHVGIKPLFDYLPTGVCPLHFPVIVKRRNEVCDCLSKKGIDAIPWWAGYHRALPWKEFDDARFLKDNLLTLPLHQDLEEDEVQFIADEMLAVA